MEKNISGKFIQLLTKLVHVDKLEIILYYFNNL